MIVNYSYQSNAPHRFETESDSIIIGRLWRGQVVDLDLTPDHTVSRRHARLSLEDGVYWLEDLGSTGGSWVNGQKITAKTRIGPTDKVTLGQTVLHVLAVSSTPEPVTQLRPEMPDGI